MYGDLTANGSAGGRAGVKVDDPAAATEETREATRRPKNDFMMDSLLDIKERVCMRFENKPLGRVDLLQSQTSGDSCLSECLDSFYKHSPHAKGV